MTHIPTKCNFFYSLNFGKIVQDGCYTGGTHCKNTSKQCQCWCHTNSKEEYKKALKIRIAKKNITKISKIVNRQQCSIIDTRNRIDKNLKKISELEGIIRDCSM